MRGEWMGVVGLGVGLVWFVFLFWGTVFFYLIRGGGGGEGSAKNAIIRPDTTGAESLDECPKRLLLAARITGIDSYTRMTGGANRAGFEKLLMR